MEHRRIIKQGPVVLATHEDGSMDPVGPKSQGLFLADTRFLSTFKLRLNDCDLVLLGSSEEILFQASFLHTNSNLAEIPERGIGVLQSNTIEESTVKVSVTLANWALKPVNFCFSVELDADFFDSFEARGVKRLRRGELIPAKVGDDSIELQYIGLDRVKRTTAIKLTPAMDRFENRRAFFDVSLLENERKSIVIEFKLLVDAPEGTSRDPEPDVARNPKPHWFDDATKLSVDNRQVQAILNRSVDDLEVLLTQYHDLWMPAAGLPRFAVPFGRDSMYTGLMTLMWRPQLSRDVLRFLAKTQGKQENAFNYEQPGKIMHEMHTGELARLGEIPFGLFYGSVDSTPLFLVLGAEYLRWTGDLDLYHELESNFDAAWRWIEKYGNISGRGYIEYAAHTPPKVASAALTVGLFNQGWKDSSTAVMYHSGQMVTDHPIALSEVQGELYRAYVLWSQVLGALPSTEGMAERSAELYRKSEQLRERFEREFWMEDRGFYAMALDGKGRQVDSLTSNPGHCLWSRLVCQERAELMAKTLLGANMFTEWGVRTMSSDEPSYNPFSYHDGSVWPFENAVFASGFKKYGMVQEMQTVFDAMVDASRYFEYQRWPEVYCGVSKQVGGVLARQPDASRPQAWSAASVFLLLQTLLGIAPRPFSKQVDITPTLPTCIDELRADGIDIVGSKLSLRLVRDGRSILLEVVDNPNDLDVLIHPATKHAGQLSTPLGPATSGQ
ncbi:MAG TPA: glycogen debranching N-terminal domain-containing protein [Chloroflexota bacterium]